MREEEDRIQQIRTDAIKRGHAQNPSMPELTAITVPVWYLLWITDEIRHLHDELDDFKRHVWEE